MATKKIVIQPGQVRNLANLPTNFAAGQHFSLQNRSPNKVYIGDFDAEPEADHSLFYLIPSNYLCLAEIPAVGSTYIYSEDLSLVIAGAR